MLTKDKIIDLHVHSYYSDGELSPEEIINLAKQNNVGIIAITDHDTILGLKHLSNLTEETHVSLIPGVELSAKVEIGQMHILGYGIDINNIELNNKLEQLKKNNRNYILTLIRQIKDDYNLEFQSNDIEELLNSRGNIGRPHIARLCVKYGYAKTVQDAFDKYLLDAYEKVRKIQYKLTYQECLQLILNSGGIPVLAHPKTLKLSDEELFSLIQKLIKDGLKGIEVYHSTHSKAEEDKYLEIAKRLNLLVSGGSDYHGPNIKPNIHIGTGKANLKIKELSLLKYKL